MIMIGMIMIGMMMCNIIVVRVSGMSATVSTVAPPLWIVVLIEVVVELIVQVYRLRSG